MGRYDQIYGHRRCCHDLNGNDASKKVRKKFANLHFTKKGLTHRRKHLKITLTTRGRKRKAVRKPCCLTGQAKISVLGKASMRIEAERFANSITVVKRDGRLYKQYEDMQGGK
ncbi:MAG: hypothetical protein E7663_02690 [Ruminococcaceae bacterium]|nr:hypothetical protein [Oscillospiraceae bacterium]